MNNRFYMMCLRETVGNNASFHCHNGNGYSSDIDRAHVYTLEEAQKAWNCGRDIDQPVCADSVDAMAVWHVDCQYIPTESLIESDCTAYVAYKKGSWNGNDVYWLQHGGLPTDDFFQPEEVDVVREALNELSVDNDDAHAEIIQKMELLTH